MNDTYSVQPTLHEVHALIHAVPETVFDALSKLSAWNTWQSDVRVLTSENRLYEGCEFKYSDSGIVINSVVTEYQPFQTVAWKSRSLWLTAEVRFTLTNEHGNTFVEFEQAIYGFGAVFFTPIIRRSMNLLIAQLSKHTEHVILPAYS